MNDAPEHNLIRVAMNGVRSGPDYGILTYAIPDHWPTSLEPGELVWAPVQKRIELGIVIGQDDSESEFEARPLHAPVVPAWRMSEIQMETAAWMARETVGAFYACAALFLPPGIQQQRTQILSLVDSEAADSSSLTKSQEKVVELLAAGGRLTLETLRKATGQKLDSVIAKLVERGIVQRELSVNMHIPKEPTVQIVRLLDPDPALTGNAPRQAEVQRVLTARKRLLRDDDAEFTTVDALRDRVTADSATLRALEKKRVIELATVARSKAPQPRPVSPPVLTPRQAAVWSTIERALANRDSKPHLLFGVTGGGKTEIYLRAAAWCMRFGRGSIILLPEIAVATQIVRRFTERFPGKVAVLHSQLTVTDRYATWKAIESGEYPIVVGPRSALFAPVKDPGLIVLDEEHEGSYKQDSPPRYHARAAATFLAEKYGATLILGSATPAIESWHRVETGEYHRLELTERVAPSGAEGGLELPPVEIVDLRDELHRSNTSLLSLRLQEVVTQALHRGEQSILLLNRRGQSTIVMCRACGHRIECPHCDIPLVFHRDRGAMICHRCDYREPPPNHCPECQGWLDYFGSGTQRVEEEVSTLFPDTRIMRWDQDSVRRQGGYTAMLDRVERGDVDVIVGTQMVAKGFDLPKVTVVGVIQADTTLHLPDFRSSERTFQLVTQVAGRAGRRAAGSRVIVQTYTPAHYAIRTASGHDYLGFYEEEIAFRKHFVYPPETRLVRCVYKHSKEHAAAIEAELMSRKLAKHAKLRGVEIDLLGPTPAFVAKIRGMYQWQIVLRSKRLEDLLDGFPDAPGWVIDVDPQGML